MKRKVIILCLIFILSIFNWNLALSTSIFTVVGSVRNADGNLTSIGMEVEVTNKTRDLAVTTIVGTRENGRYSAVFVDTQNKTVAADGDIIEVMVMDSGKTLATKTYSLTAQDISKGRAIVDVKIGSVVPSDLESVIDKYLIGKNSPMVGEGAHYSKWGTYFDVDPLLVVAISGAESNFGEKPAGNEYNVWGWRGEYADRFWDKFEPGWDPDTNRDEFSDAPGFIVGQGIYMETGYEDGIFWVTYNLRRFYFDQGLATVEEIGKKWCTEGTDDWIRNVNRFLEEMQTGTPPLISANIDGYSPSNTFEMEIGESVSLEVAFTNVGDAAWQFVAGASIWNSSGAKVADYEKTIETNLQPDGHTSVSWLYTPTQEGDYWLQFGIWKAKPYTQENLLDRKPDPSDKLIVVRSVAQPSATIFGNITDSATGKPIRGAKIAANGHSYITEADGNYLLNVPSGPCSIAASAPGYHFESDNILISEGQTLSIDFALDPRIGYVIIVAGEVEDWIQKQVFNMKADFAYNIFLALGYKDDDISYFNSNKDIGNGVDDDTAIDSFFKSITEIASQRVGPSSPLIIYMIGHSAIDNHEFILNETDAISGGTLNTWLKVLPEETKMLIAIDACFSGSFITEQRNSLSSENRIIVTSCRADEKSYPFWSLFESFWKQIYIQQGKDIRSSFINACKYNLEQGEPQFDDNGDSNQDGNSHSAEFLEENPPISEGDEGYLAANTSIGRMDAAPSLLEELMWLTQELLSPGNPAIQDSEGRVTGWANGEAKVEIPGSIYDAERKAIVIWPATDTYQYRVVGTDEGTYSLRVVYDSKETVTLNASNIPITSGAVHQYEVDWDAISKGEKGTTVQIDSDGDDSFDHSVSLDNDITQDEYLSAIGVFPQDKLIRTWGDVKLTSLLQNYPNPFNPDTWIPYVLAEQSDVLIKIYDSKGRLIRTIHMDNQPPGSYISKEKAAHWDGHNNSGETVTSGVYFYNFCAGSYKETKKMINVR
jgi:hypothetical protein